ncbi:Signal recognition particle 43 kDa protein, chloroplastic [Porphyridium purpureum]|uniref:Signal recognition particle 43 kDa protein, chloroplastic n=1 Tax=Porphyridium purpureum TaxID=35688 RepID=A0A5J4YPZ9_PORPP|nr:Signal recognition particle 43 kDa protein, chloroplastic [Porphyridium purpureum]|eukprot:POR7080..scf222_8
MEAFVAPSVAQSGAAKHRAVAGCALRASGHARLPQSVRPAGARARSYMCVAESAEGTKSEQAVELGEKEKEMLEKALKGDIVRVNKLLDLGADVHAKDENGRTLLHLIAAQGVPDLTRTLLKMGADPNAQDTMGLTPLHMAAGYKRPDTVRAFIEAGADLSLLNNRMQTPLDLARMLLDNEPDKKFVLMPNKNKEALKEIVDMLRVAQETTLPAE